MSTALIDVAVGCCIFVLGLAVTIRKYGKNDRVAFTAVAVLTPLVAIFAVFRLLYLAAQNRVELDPCPPGLEEAEKIVALQRQQMFGGPLREPTFTASWQKAYERELQKETERVQRVAHKYLALT